MAAKTSMSSSDRHKARLRGGGIGSGRRDPLRHAALHEPYAARSGAPAEETGTPDLVAKRPSARRRVKRTAKRD